MLSILIGVVQAVMEAPGNAAAALPLPYVTVDQAVLAGVGLVVGFVRCYTTRGIISRSRETVHDCFIAMLVGGSWAVPIPFLGFLWPPIDLSSATLFAKAVVVAMFTYGGLEVIKKLLMGLVPAYLEKLGAPINGGTNGGTKP